MTSSAISGRSSPRSERAVVASSSVPSSMRLTTASAVNPFSAARDPELRVDLVRDLVAAVGEAVRLREDDVAAAIDPDDAREARFRDDRVEIVLRFPVHSAI